MVSLPLTVQFFLGLGVLLVLVWPLVQDWGTRWADSDSPEEFNRKEAVLDALSDLEYEHETGKINDRDYRRLRDVYVRQAAELLDEEDRARPGSSEDGGSSAEDGDDELERAIARAREKL